jgi:enoyl-CoA hydratase/carnithine racemase
MAMPEVNIGLFPDVGGSYFLPRAPGRLGLYLGLTGEIIGPADALYAGLADIYVPSAHMPALRALIDAVTGRELRAAIVAFAAPFQSEAGVDSCTLARQRALIDRHFSHDAVARIEASLTGDSDPFAQKTLATLRKRSPLMMCVTLELLKRGASRDVADCLRMERSLVRRSFEHREILEGVRALVIDKDNAPRWDPPSLAEVTPQMIEAYFEPAWPAHAHPLRFLT